MTGTPLQRRVHPTPAYIVRAESTDHFDIKEIEQLEQALEAFSGTVVLVTLERALIDLGTL